MSQSQGFGGGQGSKAWPSMFAGDDATLFGQSVLQGTSYARYSACDCHDGTSCCFFLNVLFHTN